MSDTDRSGYERHDKANSAELNVFISPVYPHPVIADVRCFLGEKHQGKRGQSPAAFVHFGHPPNFFLNHPILINYVTISPVFFCFANFGLT